MFSIEKLVIKREKTLHVLRCEEVTLAYTWFNLNFTDQIGLFCGLLDMSCTSALALRRRMHLTVKKE